MLKTRALAALLFAPPFLWLIWRGGLPLMVTCLVLAAMLLWEYLRLTVGKDLYLTAVGFALGTLVALATLDALPPRLTAVLAPVGVVALLTAVLLRPEPIAHTLTRAGLLALGAVYAGGLIQYLARLRDLPSGFALALMALFCTWGADTGAYFAGRLFGRHKLYARISPAKTVEGAIGGLLAAIGVAFLVRALPSLLPHAWHATLKLDTAGFGLPLADWQLLVIGTLAAVLGLVGDLVESMLKRSVGAKDSGNIIPGHGGVLDRFDAVMFVAPGIYVFVTLALLP